MKLAAAAWVLTTNLMAPGLRLLLRHRAARGKEIANRLGERFGIEVTQRPPGTLVWLHAASLGETASILPVLCALPPDVQALVTTGTVSSAALLDRHLPELGLAERVRHRFVPLDVRAWVERFLDHWRPDVAGFVESELWPNLLAGCAARHIPTMLINARMSSRSFSAWSRFPAFARLVLGDFAQIQARSEPDARRLRSLGARNVSAPGDLKFAAEKLPVDSDELDRLQRMLAGRPVWIAASTHPGEDEIVFAVHRLLAARHAGLLTILIPRHAERGAAIFELTGGLAVARRALGQLPTSEEVWIADTMGELGLFYRLAPIVFVGRSLVAPGGGQNPLEPARLGCAVAVGPLTANFSTLNAILEDAGALARVADAAELAAWVGHMLTHPDERAAMAQRAAAASARHAALPAEIAITLLTLARRGK